MTRLTEKRHWVSTFNVFSGSVSQCTTIIARNQILSFLYMTRFTVLRYISKKACFINTPPTCVRQTVNDLTIFYLKYHKMTITYQQIVKCCWKIYNKSLIIDLFFFLFFFLIISDNESGITNPHPLDVFNVTKRTLLSFENLMTSLVFTMT